MYPISPVDYSNDITSNHNVSEYTKNDGVSRDNLFFFSLLFLFIRIIIILFSLIIFQFQ